MTATTALGSWMGVGADDLRGRLGVARIVVYDSLPSTMDVAHSLAAGGAEHGSIVLTEVQSAGRGRLGRRWLSGRGDGIWLSMILRPGSPESSGVLSLRVALELARALEPLADGRLELKWPNDIFLDGLKLGGVLSEARWRGTQLEWVVVGTGVNLRVPEGLPAASLRGDVDPASALEAVARALLRAGNGAGKLSDAELAEWNSRDRGRDRRCVSPGAGVVAGITAAGELIVDSPDGRRLHSGGSLVLAGDP